MAEKDRQGSVFRDGARRREFEDVPCTTEAPGDEEGSHSSQGDGIENVRSEVGITVEAMHREFEDARNEEN